MVVCTGCGRTRARRFFGLSKRSHDGLDSRCLSCRAAYQRAHRKALKPTAKAQNRQRYQEPVRNISARISVRIRQSLRTGRAVPDLELRLGYSIQQLMQHLERQFPKGMSWANMGRWHIDHRVPLSSFRFESTDDPEFHAAWALTNLCPLWKRRNLRKGDSRELLL